MAAPSKSVGYKCEFVDQVPEDYFCKQCSHVAREPTIASCCTEVFCKACIKAVIEDKKPCPNCQETDISYIPHKKYQPKILALKVHCSLKDCGCEWTGQLQHLDAHLDLTTGDCVYVDVDCPSKCNQKVQKHYVDTHLASHCPNRDYTCPHCSFKATFHEVSEHFKVCRYYPLVCPNRCGASFERDVLEEHMKMCGLQELQCEFSYAGCGAEFIRDDQKEHMEQNTQKHLALVAAATLRISQEQQREFDQKLEDKDSEIKAIVNNEASRLVNEQRQQSDAQIRALEVKLQEQQQYLNDKDQQIKTLEEQHGSAINSLRMEVCIPPYEVFVNYREIAARRCSRTSLPMYTHPWGYKFQLRVQPPGRNCFLSIDVCPIKSMNVDKLKFPARFTITLELLNQHRDQDHRSRDIQCEVTREKLGSYKDIGCCQEFILETDLE